MTFPPVQCARCGAVVDITLVQDFGLILARARCPNWQCRWMQDAIVDPAALAGAPPLLDLQPINGRAAKAS